jgi:hypothetical protein
LLKLSETARERRDAIAERDVLLSHIGYWYGELKDLTHPHAVLVRKTMQSVMDDYAAKNRREPEPYMRGMVKAESYSHGQQIMERLERAAEQGQ